MLHHTQSPHRAILPLRPPTPSLARIVHHIYNYPRRHDTSNVTTTVIPVVIFSRCLIQ